MEAQRDRDRKTIQATAEDHAHDPAENTVLTDKRLPDDQAGKRDRHHAGAEVNITGLLIMSYQAAGKRRHRAGNAQAYGNGKARIDAGRLHHILVVSGRADRKSYPRAEKPCQKHTHDHNDNDRYDQAVPVASQHIFEQAVDCLVFKNRQVGRKAHYCQIHGIQPRVHDDPGKDRLHTELCLKRRHDKAGTDASRHRRKQRKHRMSHDRHLRAHGAAQRKAPVRRQVGNVQDGIAQKQGQRDQRVDKAELQSTDDDRKR